jgi:hypothetical protein
MGNWVHTENSEKGTANELSKYFFNLEKAGKIYLPNLRATENLYLFSDYIRNKNQEHPQKETLKLKVLLSSACHFSS